MCNHFKMSKGKIRTCFAILVAIVVTVSFGLTAIGCNPESYYDREIKIARENFGCEKILWIGGAVTCNSISGVDKVDTEFGPMYTRDTVLGPRGGRYVIGLNKKGEEQFILIPTDENVKVNNADEMRPSYKSTLFDWPFTYSFSEMSAFMGEHGYKYAGGIDGRINEYVDNHDTLYANARSSDIMSHYHGDDCEEFYNRLDVEFTFSYYVEHGECHLAQEGGKLKLYEWRFTDDGITTEVHVYGE